MDATWLTQAIYTLQPARFGNLISQNRLDSEIWEVSYHHYDGLGSTDNLTDSAQVVTDMYLCSSFGEVLMSSGTTTNPYQFVGRQGYYDDPILFLLDLRARMCRPTISQFLSTDPIF